MRVQQQAANNQLPQPLYEPRSTHTPTHANSGGTVLNTSLVVVTAPGKRPATFRTWKLSPAAPMVLQPIGCGRVGHRHNTPKQVRASSKRMGSFAYQAQPLLAGRARSSEGIAALRHHGTCIPNDSDCPALLHSHDPRRLSYRPLPGPQFDQLTPRDTTHQRTNVAHICPRGMGCLMHGSFCTSARVASPQR